MGTKLETGAGSTLYAFWGPAIAEELRARLSAMARTRRPASVSGPSTHGPLLLQRSLRLLQRGP
jgi:hypothetical protein